VLMVERGFTRKTSPAYVQACCVFRAVSAANVGVAMYLECFPGTEEERVFLLKYMTNILRNPSRRKSKTR